MLESSFKTHNVRCRSHLLHSQIYLIMVDMVLWFQDRNQNPIITDTRSTLKEDEAIGRVSRTHREGRAFDLRTWDLPKDLVSQAKSHFTDKYGHMGALSSRNLKPNLIVHHDAGTGQHFHVQVSPEYRRV